MTCMHTELGIVCVSFAKQYRYLGWFFEYSQRNGPHPLRKDGELTKNIDDKFWPIFDEWWHNDNREDFEVKQEIE